MIAECDLRVSLHAKRWFDAVGHYSREDILPARLERAFAGGRHVSRGSSSRSPPTTVSRLIGRPARPGAARNPRIRVRALPG